MLRSELKVGQQVKFGRPNGEHTVGVIEKLNPTKAKIKQLENRGRTNQIGTIWTVPYSLIYPSDGNIVQVPKPELKYSPFSGIDNLILEAIFACYADLSPENLTGDGELSRSAVQSRRSVLNRQLRGLQSAYGREVEEEEIYQWWRSKNEYKSRTRTGS